MKKSKRKNTKANEFRLFALGTLLVLLVTVLTCVFLKLFQSDYYKIEDRLTKIEEKQEAYQEKILGWVRVQGTNIDYPVIYNDDDLNLDSVRYDFGWTNKSTKKLGNRELILGHNILNVSKNPTVTDPNHTRFEQLMSFIYYDFAEKNQYIQYTKDGENHLYQIFAVGFIDDSKLSYYENNYSKKELTEYINEARKNSFYDYQVEVTGDDDILTLVTCTRFYGLSQNVDFKIDARKVRKNEVIGKNKLAKSAKYDKIREEMKGDEADEKV